jgi:CMP-N-acetylneuraminic acid synthetase
MIALILARGGSKRVPGKNIKPLDGIPLIGHVITAANDSKLIEKVYVSTDDSEIKAVSEFYGAIVIDRPDNLSEDYSTDIEAFVHFIEETGYSGNIVHLRATTPLLDPEKLDEGIEFFLKHEKDCHSMRSAHEMPRTAYKCFEKDGMEDNKTWKGMFDDKPGIPKEYYNLPNQSLPRTYAPNGYIDIVKTEVFKRGKLMHGYKILAFETEFTQEVDTQEDFDYIEYTINKKKNE